MNTLTTFLTAAAFALFALSSPAMAQGTTRDPGQTQARTYLEAALRRDPRTAARRAALESSRAELAALESRSRLTFSAGSGEAGYAGAGSTPGGEAGVSFGPWAELDVSGPLNLKVKASVPTVIPLGGSASSVEPALTISQSLTELLFKKPDLALLRAELAALNAEKAVSNAEVDATAKALAALRDWAAAENELAAARSKEAAAVRARRDAVALGLYRAGSVAMTRLENAALAASLSVEKAERTLARRKGAVAELCGLSPDDKAPAPPPASYPDLAALAPASSQAVAAAAAALDLERLAFEEAWGVQPPKLGWTGSLALDAPEANAADAAATPGLEAAVGLTLEKGSFTAGTSFGWNGVNDRPSVGFSLSWIPGDKKAEARQAEVAAAALRASEAEYLGAVETAAAELAELRLEASLAEVDGRRLEASYEEARLGVLELAEMERLGLAERGELDEAREEMYAAASALEAAAWNAAIRAASIRSAWDLGGGAHDL